jgi:hypothetical protein
LSTDAHKLLPGSKRFQLVAHMLRERLSPEQIAGKLRSMNIPSLKENQWGQSMGSAINQWGQCH